MNCFFYIFTLELEELLLKAENDHEESQFELGKHYFDQYEAGGSSEDADVAVKWLLKSSRKGNERATDILAKCLVNNIGVTDKNHDDVYWCVHTSNWEKRSRYAASKLFRKICLGDKVISKAEYKERVAEFSRNKLEKKLLEKAVKDKISEEDFVNRLMKQLHGKSSWSLKLLVDSDSNLDPQNDLPIYKKALLYPGHSIRWIVDNIVETAGTQGYMWLKTLIPVQQVYMLVVLFVYSLISIEVIVWIVPIVGFYLSLFVIIICTMQMFYTRRKLNDVKVLADMLGQFSDTFIQESAESAYTWNSLTPYITFFLSLPVLNVTFALADKTWIPCAEITCISIVITVACWFALSDRYDYLAMLSIMLDNVATLPTFVSGMPMIPIIYPFLDFIANTGISYNVYSELEIKLCLPSIAYLVVPIIFVNMAMRKSWSGTYQILIPHLVCFFWWRISVMLFPHTTWMSLLRASCGWGVLIALSPFIITMGAAYLFIFLLRMFSFTGFLKLLTTLCLLASVALFAYWSRGGFKFGKFSLENKSAKANIILIIFLIFSAIPIAYIAVPDDSGKPTNYLPWDIYDKHCGSSRLDNSMTASVMFDCYSFTQAKVNWTGYVKQTALKHVDNQAEGVISLLPTLLSNWLRCTYGDEYPDDCTILKSDLEIDVCQYNKVQGRLCHLTKLNRYTFEITIVPYNSDQMFKLILPHMFSDAVLNLKKGDEVLFRGFLSENLGNTLPTIKVYNFRCTSCLNFFTTIQPGSWSYLEWYKRGLYSIFNFFFSPLFVFSTKE